MEIKHVSSKIYFVKNMFCKKICTKSKITIIEYNLENVVYMHVKFKLENTFEIEDS